MSNRRIKKHTGQKTMYPIKCKKELRKCFDWLEWQVNQATTQIKQKQAYRNLMFFMIGVNTALRAEDLLQLRVKDVYKGVISVKQNKNNKLKTQKFRNDVYEEIKKYIHLNDLKLNDYLFMGQKTKTTYKGITTDVITPITKQNALVILKGLARGVGIMYPFGIHSLRKTYAYHLFVETGNIASVCQALNHTDIKVTMRYIMWNNADAEDDINNFGLL